MIMLLYYLSKNKTKEPCYRICWLDWYEMVIVFIFSFFLVYTVGVWFWSKHVSHSDNLHIRLPLLCCFLYLFILSTLSRKSNQYSFDPLIINKHLLTRILKIIFKKLIFKKLFLYTQIYTWLLILKFNI